MINRKDLLITAHFSQEDQQGQAIKFDDQSRTHNLNISASRAGRLRRRPLHSKLPHFQA